MKVVIRGKTFDVENNPNTGKMDMSYQGDHIGVAPNVEEAKKFIEANFDRITNEDPELVRKNQFAVGNGRYGSMKNGDSRERYKDFWIWVKPGFRGLWDGLVSDDGCRTWFSVCMEHSADESARKCKEYIDKKAGR